MDNELSEQLKTEVIELCSRYDKWIKEEKFTMMAFLNFSMNIVRNIMDEPLLSDRENRNRIISDLIGFINELRDEEYKK